MSTFLRTFLVLAGVTFLGPLALDASLPAFGAMQQGLGASAGAIKMTLGAVTAGMAAGQVVFGAMADRFGRRPIMSAGLALFTAAAFLVTLIDSVGPMVALRFAQGLGISAVTIASRASVRDQFDVAESARLFAYLLVVLGFVPVIGPVVFGWMTETFGWRSIFYAMGVVSGVGWLVIILGLGETIAALDTEALRLAGVATGYGRILWNRYFAAHLVVALGAYIVLFAIIGGIAPVMMDVLGETPRDFGLKFAGVLVANLIGASLVGWGIKLFGMRGIVAFSAAIMGISGALFAAVAFAGQVTATVVLVPSFVALLGFGLINPVLAAGALTNFRAMAGRASALYGFSTLTIGAGTLFLLGALDDGTARPMAVALALGGGGAVLTYIWLLRPLPVISGEGGDA
ncbi:MAG: MFS transporter [Pseudomonadota bacterium]|nr:MFS transporter [Pseudomonadota bacterium]